MHSSNMSTPGINQTEFSTDISCADEVIEGAVAPGVKNPLWYRLPERVAVTRESLGITQAALGDRAGLAQSTFAKYENGSVMPTLVVTEKVAAALGVPPCWLAFGAWGEDRFQNRIPTATPAPPHPNPVEGGLPYLALNEGSAERLRTRREALGLSLRDLGAAAGVSYEGIRKMEQRYSSPKLDLVWRLAVALDVSPCWLSFGIGDGPGAATKRRLVERVRAAS